MKKILGISLVAVLAVSPMMAMADPDYSSAPAARGDIPEATVTASVGAKYATVDETANTNIATTSYVKGAYNAAIKAVNKVAEDAASSMTTTLEDYATKEGVVATVEKATVSGTVSGTATGTVTVSTDWSNDATTDTVAITTGFSDVALSNGAVSLANDKYYEDMEDTTGTSFTPAPGE